MTRHLILLALGCLCELSGCGGESAHVGIPPMPCENAKERVAGSGFVECASGLVHRPAVGTCPAYQQSTATRPSSREPDQDECTSDLACTARPYGYCESNLTYHPGLLIPNRCAYGCTNDTECAPGNVCVCTEERGECHASTCQTDADCGANSLCAEYSQSCDRTPGLACQTPSDRCQLNSDCPNWGDCVMTDNGYRACHSCAY